MAVLECRVRCYSCKWKSLEASHTCSSTGPVCVTEHISEPVQRLHKGGTGNGGCLWGGKLTAANRWREAAVTVYPFVQHVLRQFHWESTLRK